MPAFNNFNNRLPDPTFTVNDAGVVDSAGTRGPGFASVSVRSVRPAQVSRTNSGRGVHRETGSHNWEISIKYNPMLRNDFDTVQGFLDSRNGRLKPFYVVLPQHSKPKDPVFATFVTNNPFSTVGTHQAGSPTIMITAANTVVGKLKPGDYLNIDDPTDANHQKAYKVAAVENNSTYNELVPRPSTSQLRVHLMPPLTKTVLPGAKIRFINPTFRVIQKSDTLEYELNTDNLYSYQLDLEEIQP